MTDKTGGSAFPLPQGSETTTGCDGMTLRDYFAAKAMQGILSNHSMIGDLSELSAKWVTEGAYRMADAMLRAREK